MAPDILVLGGGIAGLSAAAAFARDAKVVVLEAEDQIGFHASGRSATMLHYALGDRLVRELTQASRGFFDDPPEYFHETPVAHRMPVLVFARDDEVEELDDLGRELAPFATLERLDDRAVHDLCPLLNADQRHGIADLDGLRLDPHALLQGNLRQLRGLGGTLVTNARVARIERAAGTWSVITEQGEKFSAPVLVNAAGAWADAVARLAGVTPLSLQPRRRTIITFDAPAGTKLDGLPFAKTVGDELYFAPESGRLFASPMDQVPSEPCDAQPDELEMAMAAHAMEQRTIVRVSRIQSRWAGLRTFTSDGHPAIGFDDKGEGFFWLVGQGGFGLQTSPALSTIASALVRGDRWPFPKIDQNSLSPRRFRADRSPAGEWPGSEGAA